MHLPTISLLLATAAATPSAVLQRRCSPARDPEWHMGYLPPAPCWQDFNTACRPQFKPDTTMLVSRERRAAVVFGVSQWCWDIIAEEKARAADGRKIYGWEAEHGTLTRVGDSDVLVISGMSEETVEEYFALPGWGGNA